MARVHKTPTSLLLLLGTTLAVGLVETGGCQATTLHGYSGAVPQNRFIQIQAQTGNGAQIKPMAEEFIRAKCDVLAGKAGLPKDLQDVRLLYPGLDLTFAEFLCGAFAAGAPVHFLADPDDADIIRVQIKAFNLDFMRGHVLDDGTFLRASSPVTGGTPALNYASVTNTQTGEQNTEPAILMVLHQGWSSQMEAYLKQQQ
jgi:hypothetical protein